MEQHKAIFMGEKVRLMYFCSNGYASRYSECTKMPSIKTYYDHLEYIKIAECLLDSPPLGFNDRVYISDLNEKSSVKDIARSTNNEYIYYLNYYSEIINDSYTIESKKKAEKEISIELEKFNKELAKFKKWYQFWK